MILPPPCLPVEVLVTRGDWREHWASWNDFKISILVILYGSDCFDLAAARYVCMKERERFTENRTNAPHD